MNFNYIMIILVSLVLSSCDKIQVENSQPESSDAAYSYLYISHTKSKEFPYVNTVIEDIRLQEYKYILLGGDLGNNTSNNDTSLIYLDSIFNLSSLNTLWSIGNHDDHDRGLLFEYTKRPFYYSSHHKGVTFIVLDTQESWYSNKRSDIVGEQLEFFNNVIDSLDATTHLVVMHHKLIWMKDNIEIAESIDSVSNGPVGNCHWCLNPSNFYTSLYPQLIDVRDKGINVTCVSGDTGENVPRFEHLTKDSIQFLASGINAYRDDGQVLIFDHDVNKDILNWRFVPIDEL